MKKEINELNMTEYNVDTESLEEYLNRRGFSLGRDANWLDDLQRSLIRCKQYGLLKDNEFHKLCKRYQKLFGDHVFKILYQ